MTKLSYHRTNHQQLELYVHWPSGPYLELVHFLAYFHFQKHRYVTAEPDCFKSCEAAKIDLDMRSSFWKSAFMTYSAHKRTDVRRVKGSEVISNVEEYSPFVSESNLTRLKLQNQSSLCAAVVPGVLLLMALLVLLCLCTIILLHELYARYRARHLPPGVSGLRCLFEIPNDKAWIKMLKFNQQYGDIASGSLFGYNIIIIGSAKIADELLEKRGVNYADRPRSVMCGELSGWGKIMLLSNYNEWFRTHRKWFAQDIGNHASVAKFHRTIEFECRRYLRCVLENPQKNQSHVRKYLTSIILRLSHGYATREGDDPLVDLAHVANSQLSMATAPGLYYVDFLPLMKYIPSWLPGAGFKRKAKKYAAVLHDLVEIPHNYVKSQLAAGTALPSLSSRILSQPGLTEELEDSIKWATATMYQGGADTANSVSYAFYLAMTLHPHVMKKAQQELDSVVGPNRLPTFTDRSFLPYMEALFTELLRWHTPGPMTMRCTRVEDKYDKYLIPAGAYIMVNIWAILRDERTYSDPTVFEPERFLGNNPEPHPGNACFGFGRRKCPGYFLGHSSVWLMCAQALAVFDISKCVENDVELTPEFNLVGETIVHQAPFKCSIKPRSQQARHLINQEFPPFERPINDQIE